MTLPDDVEVDVYCNHLTPIFDNVAFPYTGAYGAGMMGAAGWAAEQALQAEKLVDYVRTRSGDRPAVILGDFNAGRAVAGTELQDEGVETVAVFESAFTLASPEPPVCTFCPANGNNVEDTEPVFIDQIWLYGDLEASGVARTFDEDIVPVEGGIVPLSDHYGLKAEIEVY